MLKKKWQNYVKFSIHRRIEEYLMTRYIIALSELNIKNSDIIILLQNHYDDIKNMFENIGI